MPKFSRNKRIVPKRPKRSNAPSGKSASPELSRAQKNIYRQALLAGLTVVLTIVIVFAMTSAWYTNIVQTSGLTFKAESWGFDGEIVVDETPIVASPGDDGLVQLEVQSTSDSISSISVNVSKTGMLEEMQKRLFFYVDTHMIRDGETMDRVYLNNYEGYTYTLFSKGNLTLTEEASNAPQIKWQWVYDVLGYYVLGQVNEITTTDAEGNETGTVQTMTIREYLRPIEYDFDEATTVLKTVGDELTVDLSTVDGTNSPEIYLWLLSKNDGYEGEIDPQNKLSNGYYPVSVDKNGYGVYAYLCNYSEIVKATQYDTMLGELAYEMEKNGKVEAGKEDYLSHPVTLTLSAQKNESAAVNVNTLSALQNAITKGTADIVQLGSDISIPAGDTLTIPKNTRVMLDLNGKTISASAGEGTAIKAEQGSSLTLINGSIAGPGDSTKTYGINTNGAEVVMSKVSVTDFRYGIYMGDNENSNELDSRVHMVDCTIDAEWYAVFISGNGSLSAQKTQLIIENSKLSSDGIVITGNGSATGNGRWGTDIQILNSTITANISNGTRGSGIYQPQQNSTMTINNSTVEGYVGVAIKGGSVNIIDSTIKGTGAYQAPAFSGSGFTDTGDAVYVETGYGYEILLKISGSSTLTSDNSQSLQVYDPNATNVKVEIESGIFDEEQPDSYLAEGSTQAASGATYVVTAPAQ